MRRRFIAVVIGSACAAMTLVACGSGSSNNGTSTAISGASSATPRGSATAAATPTAVTPTAAAEAPTAAAPTPPPVAQPTQPPPTQGAPPTKAPPPPPPPTQPPSSQTRTIVAENIAFNPKQLTASAGVPLTITLDNRDADVVHDIIIYAPGSSTVVAQTSVISGPATTSTTFTPAAPGTYPFKCSVHPQQMFGAIAIQ